MRAVAAAPSRRVALLVRATAAPAKPQVASSSKVDTSLTPKAQGFTMPGEFLLALLQCLTMIYFTTSL
jgi:hypothetical protein